jgi:demethylspheroidene O-methyltransferase
MSSLNDRVSVQSLLRQGGAAMPAWKEMWITRRNAVLGKPAFQKWASAFPLTRPVSRRYANRLFNLGAGFAYSQIVRACVELDLFAKFDSGPQSAADIAAACDLPIGSAETLLKAALPLDLLESLGDGRYMLGQTGAALSANAAVKAMIRHHLPLYLDLTDPVALLRSGGGKGALAGFWPYGDGNAQAAGRYSELMAASQPMIAEQVIAAHDFAAHKKLLDIGGGEGAFLEAVGAQHPALGLMLLDLPDVAARAVNRLGKRVAVFPGSFISDAMPQGADCLSLVRVLHDHDDDVVTALLAKAHGALPPGGTLILAEPMAETKGAEAMGHAYFGLYLLAMGSGRPRTAQELTKMLRAAGFSHVKESRTAIPLICRVIVARA